MANRQFARVFLALTTALWGSAAIAENHGHMHHHFPKDIESFHAILAPVWHAPEGKERSSNACAKVAGMAQRAGDIRSADATALLASIVALKSRCDTDPADINAPLSDVHQAFHGLTDAKPNAAKR